MRFFGLERGQYRDKYIAEREDKEDRETFLKIRVEGFRTASKSLSLNLASLLSAPFSLGFNPPPWSS